MDTNTPQLYGRAVTMDEIFTAIVELPETVQLLKWYGVGLGVLLVYIAVKVSKR
jgi:purine-cytosine permease-like protein